MLVEMSRLAFHFEARRGLTEAERNRLKNYLYGRVSGQVNTEMPKNDCPRLCESLASSQMRDSRNLFMF